MDPSVPDHAVIGYIRIYDCKDQELKVSDCHNDSKPLDSRAIIEAK